MALFERTLHRFAPGYVPLYSMVSFSRIPYGEAVARAERENRIVLAAAIILVIILFVAL